MHSRLFIANIYCQVRLDSVESHHPLDRAIVCWHPDWFGHAVHLHALFQLLDRCIPPGVSLLSSIIVDIQRLTEHCSAASAVAANIMLRSIVAAGFPLFTRQMFANLGIQWAGTLLGCLAAIMIPIPLVFFYFGATLRRKSKILAKEL